MKANLPISDNPRVVIVGGGFGGINVANALADQPYQVVMLDRHNYHTFQPLLYQVATGGLEPDSIAFPLRKMFGKQKNSLVFFWGLWPLNRRVGFVKVPGSSTKTQT